MIYGSVCSGIEAATVAWHPLGWKPAFFSEIEAFPRAVLSHHYPAVPLHGDFTTIQADDYEPIDLLVGGTPCQSFSVAGLRGGMADERGNLALEYLRLADRLRPRWLVWENVPGVLSSAGGRDFGSFLGGLGQLGYGFAYRVLDAQFFGLAQRRKRVFVVGHLGDWRRAAAVLSEPASLRGHPAPRREAGAGTACGALAGTSPGGGWRVGADEAAAGQIVARSLNSHHGRMDGDTETLIAGTLQASGKAAGSATQQDAEAGLLVAGTLMAAGSRSRGAGTDPGMIATTLRARDGSKGVDSDCTDTLVPVMAFDCKASGQNGFGIGEIASTQRAMGHRNTHQNGGGHQAVSIGSAVRRLTPRECERLQGFPDDYTLIPMRGKPAADGPRYRALGNSMAVPCMAWIGRRIEAENARTAA